MSAAGVERLRRKMLPDFARSFGEFLEIARYAPPIPWDADVVRAYARRTLALDLEFGNEHTVAIMRVLRTVLADEMGAELDEWATNKAEVLRRPITVTAAELRDQLGEAEFLWRRATLRVERTQRLVLMIAFLAVAGMALMTLFGGMVTLAQRGVVTVTLTAAAAMVAAINVEGSIRSAVPFSAETVERYASPAPTQAAGAALLRLAWRHRPILLT